MNPFFTKDPIEVDRPTPCAGDLGELWFSDSAADIKEAKRLCGTCPVRTRCLDDALKNRERHGTWGGMSATERAKLLKLEPEPDIDDAA